MSGESLGHGWLRFVGIPGWVCRVERAWVRRRHPPNGVCRELVAGLGRR